MKLHEIIQALEEPTNSVQIDTLIPYKKSLFTYYENYFCCEPILMVTMVSNAVQYAQIVSANDFTDAVFHWVESMNLSDEDKESEIEVISYNSIPLKEL